LWQPARITTHILFVWTIITLLAKCNRILCYANLNTAVNTVRYNTVRYNTSWTVLASLLLWCTKCILLEMTNADLVKHTSAQEVTRKQQQILLSKFNNIKVNDIQKIQVNCKLNCWRRYKFSDGFIL
jgi:hypothetical protein